MRLNLILTILSLLPVSVVASEPAPRLEDLAREMRFELRGESVPLTVTLYFARLDAGQAYYLGTVRETGTQYSHWESDVFARVTPQPDAFLLELVRGEPGLLIQARIAPDARVGTTVHSDSVSTLKLGQELTVEESNPYWYEFDGAPTPVAGQRRLVLRNRIAAHRTSARIGGSVQLTGPLDFDGCDGCEHGDQFFLGAPGSKDRVEVLGTDFGRFHVTDCPGTPSPWLQFLLDHQVPVTYVGPLTALSASGPWGWEGDYWTSAPGGKLYLGSTTRLELVPFLESLDSQGRFVGYSRGRLSFRTSRGRTLRIDLRQGTVSSR